LGLQADNQTEQPNRSRFWCFMDGEKPKARILVLDDEAVICALLCERLSLEGYECRACYKPSEALALMVREQFDLVLSDGRMPEMSGISFLEDARPRYPRTAFLMVTGEEDIRVGIQAMKQGASDYLLKPIQLDVLTLSVERAIGVKRMELELESYRCRLEEAIEGRTHQLESAMRRIEMTYDETLEALGAALDLRDTETAGHSKRVSGYCLEMAAALGRPKDELRHIMRGSYLHNIGKIGIPDAILLKEEKLTPEEMTVMQTHVRIGYDLVSRIAFLAPAAAIVLTHQEKWDGTGYPQGLVGDEIPLGARIFAIADTLDAMTSDRPYRKALTFSTARDEIVRFAGKQFDPEIVQLFCSLPEERWESIRRDMKLPRLAEPVPHSVAPPLVRPVLRQETHLATN
jgi:response regulator RpfG family c-di-GMP phosphodiesterase